MALLVLKMSVSLDGYVAPVDGSTDWIAAGASDDRLSWTVETVSNASAHLVGAATYTGWAGYGHARPMAPMRRASRRAARATHGRDPRTVRADLAVGDAEPPPAASIPPPVHPLGAMPRTAPGL